MIVYGRNPVREALRGPRRVERVWTTKNASRLPWLTHSGVAVEMGSAQELEQRCGSPSHQGVCAEVEPFHYADPQQLLAQPTPLIVALDQVQDPQNLGSICRTAECAGAAGVVLPERRSAIVTGAVCKASAGAVEHIAVARVRNLVDFLKDAKRAGLWCYGADADAATSYESVDYSDKAGVGARLGGPGTATTSIGLVRSARLASHARSDRVAECRGCRRGPGIRSAVWPARHLTAAATCAKLAPGDQHQLELETPVRRGCGGAGAASKRYGARGGTAPRCSDGLTGRKGPTRGKTLQPFSVSTSG